MSSTLMKLGLLALLLPACSPSGAAAPGPMTSTVSAAPVVSTPPATPPVATAVTAAPPSVAVRTEAPPPRATDLHVERLVVARGVVDREPQGVDTVFTSNDKRLFAFVEVDNPERAQGDLKVTFVQPDGTSQPPVDLAVGTSPRWRTWAFTRRARAAGTWKAVVRDESGRVLASTEFDVRG
jgi:Protein of unknown function (DUF2914)